MDVQQVEHASERVLAERGVEAGRQAAVLQPGREHAEVGERVQPERLHNGGRRAALPAGVAGCASPAKADWLRRKTRTRVSVYCRVS